MEETAEGGHQRGTHGFSSMLLADCSERINVVSARGGEDRSCLDESMKGVRCGKI